jgi:hypothetical protein
MGSDANESLLDRRVAILHDEEAKSGRSLPAGAAGVVVSELNKVGTVTIRFDSGEFIELHRSLVRPL